MAVNKALLRGVNQGHDGSLRHKNYIRDPAAQKSSGVGHKLSWQTQAFQGHHLTIYATCQVNPLTLKRAI